MKDEDKTKEELIKELAAFRKTGDWLNSILDSSLDCIVFTDVQGIITRINKSFTELLGLKEEDIIGKQASVFTLCKEGVYNSRAGEPIEINREFFDYRKTFVSRLSVEGKTVSMKNYYVDRYNRVIPVESNTVYLYNESGVATGAVSIIRDMTEKEKAEEEIREAQIFIENILNLSTDGIMVADRMGRVLSINKAIEQMLGYEEDELVGKYTMQLGPPEKDQVREFMMAQLFEKGYVKDWRTTWYRKDGSLCSVEINIAFLTDREGKPSKAVAVIRDLTNKPCKAGS